MAVSVIVFPLCIFAEEKTKCFLQIHKHGNTWYYSPSPVNCDKMVVEEVAQFPRKHSQGDSEEHFHKCNIQKCFCKK